MLEAGRVRIVARKVRRLSLPSGTLDAFQVVLDGDLSVLPETIYVSTQTPQRILRTARPKQRLSLEHSE